MRGRTSRRRRKAVKRQVGAPPGTLTTAEAGPRPVVRVIGFGPDGVVEREIEDLSRLREHLGRHPVTWVNVLGVGDVDVVQRVGEIFGLHPLALEDVLHVDQRAKVDRYGDIVYVVAHHPSFIEHLETEQISLFVGRDFVVSFQEREGDCLAPVGDRIRQRRPRLVEGGPAYLAYALLDTVIDGNFPVLERLRERLEDLEDLVLDDPDDEVLGRIRDVKHNLLTLRRSLWPHREMVTQLVREDAWARAGDVGLYLRDLYDHVVQIIDLIEAYREIGTDLMSVYMSNVSNRMNEIMKVLTVIATVFIPLSFIAGVYGMNFDRASPWNMPELGWRWGYAFALGVMAAVALVLLGYFRRKGWLGGGRRKPGAGPR